MKTRVQIRKTMIAACMAVIAFASLSLQANAQTTCHAGFTFTVNTNTVTFTNTSTGATIPSYNWSYGDSNYDWQTNPSHTYLNNGTYMVCLTLYDSSSLGGCQSSFCDSIIITNAPVNPCNGLSLQPSWTNSSSNGACDASINANVTGGVAPYIYTWTPNVSNGSSANNLCSGYYTITATDANGCTVGTTVNVLQDSSNTPCNLVANFTSNTSNDPTVAFTSTSTGVSGTSYYSWNFGDGNYGYGLNETHTYQHSGTYQVCLTVGDSLNSSNGCYDTYCANVTIVNASAQPCNALFTSYHDSLNTLGSTVYFYDASTGGPTSWSWSFGDGTSSTLQSPVHQYAQPGTYLVCLTISSDSGVTTCNYCDSIVIGNVNPASCGVGIQMWQDSTNALQWYVYASVSGTAPFTYSWDFGDGSTSTQQYPSHNYTTAGHYLICLSITDATGCTSSTCDSTYRINPNTAGGVMQYLVSSTLAGIEETNVSVNSIFPNPANDMIEVSLSELVKGDIKITDMLGQEVYHDKINSNNVKVNVSTLPVGYYNLSIVSGTKTAHSKIMIVR